MAQSGVSVAPECISAFNELKLGKDTKWIIYKISDDWKEIVVEESSKEADWSVFREKLLNAKSKDRKGKEGIGGRYAVFDVEYELENGEGTRSKITFIIGSPRDEGDLGACALTVFDVEYELENGEGTRSKITFISWTPDDAPQYPRMMYSSSKEAIKRALNGLAADIQANDADDIEFDNIKSRVSKGR